MEYKDIIDFLFNKKEDEELLNLDDEELKNLDNKITICDTEITKFIDSKVDSQCRKQLKRLILEYSNSMCNYFHKENELLYHNGFSDGVEIIIKALSK